MGSNRTAPAPDTANPARGLKPAWAEFKRSPPGERFRRFYDRKQAWVRNHPLASKVAFVVALLLVAEGVVSFVFPVLPGGAVTLVAGLALIAGHWPWLAEHLDRAEVSVRKWLCRRLGDRKWLACRHLAKT